MNQEVMATYFKWGQRKNRTLITILLCIAMLISLGIQGFQLLKIFQEKPVAVLEPKSELTTEPQAISVKDFDLLFGFNNKTEAQNNSADIPKTKLNLILRGALADIGASAEDSSAIIQGSSQDKLYSPGDSLPGGVTLKEIHPDHVILSRNGQLEKLFFPDSGKDSRALLEYRSPVPDAAEQATERPGFTQQPDDKSLEQRMQELRDKLQQANQGIQ
ncbi:type II secretion system protein N [Endozoicomonas montiporae]|uniref:General secretion pathway protein N n=1 Tax=Endozoicomonas montiporae CL-33 TaxID=570277 RepID=A0A142BAN5_9GAMM|nr:type II secretion system protein N [Endozoicomonas montiporae]AMO55811.1 general secretion pathway protein N [Endozoicomonas montiporae CL-33]